jgi:hypothetical protein
MWTPPDGGGDPGDDDSTAADDDTVPGDDDSTPSPLDADVAAMVALVEGGDGWGAWFLAAAGASPLSPSAEEAVIEATQGRAFPMFDDVANGPRLLSQAERHYPGPYDLWGGEAAGLVGAAPVLLPVANDGFGLDLDDGLLAELDAGVTWNFTVPDGEAPAGSWEGPAVPAPTAVGGRRVVGPYWILDGNNPVAIDLPLPSGAQEDLLIVLGQGSAGPLAGAFAPVGAQVVFDPATVPNTWLTGEPLPAWIRRAERRVVDVDGQRLLLSAQRWSMLSVLPAPTGARVLAAPGGAIQAGGTRTFLIERRDGPAWNVAPSDLHIGGRSVGATLVDSDHLEITWDASDAASGWAVIRGELSGDRGAVRVELTPPNCDIFEVEPGNDSMLSADPLTVGQVACGAIDEGGDVDIFAFEATAGATYRFTIWADRLGVPLDATLRLLDSSGWEQHYADQWWGNDPQLDWSAPYSGSWFLQVGSYYPDEGGPGLTWRLQSLALPAPGS